MTDINVKLDPKAIYAAVRAYEENSIHMHRGWRRRQAMEAAITAYLSALSTVATEPASAAAEPVAWEYGHQEIVFGKLTEVKTLTHAKPKHAGVINVRPLYAQPFPNPPAVTEIRDATLEEAAKTYAAETDGEREWRVDRYALEAIRSLKTITPEPTNG